MIVHAEEVIPKTHSGDGAGAAATARAANAMISPAATILIVDDEIQNRALLETLLRREGYLTLTAADGEGALASIAERAPDLILLDIMMPGMDGYQVAGILKANPVTAKIPVIMVTALIDRKARLAGLDVGVEEFLTKPVDWAELSLRVRNLLRLKASADALKNQSWILEQQVQERTAELRASELRFRQMAENIRDVFFLRDADSNRMLYISPAYEEICGRSCESLYANPESWTEAIHPDDRAATYEKFKNRMSAGTFEHEYRIVRPDGSIRWMEVRSFPVRDVAGRIVRIAGVAEDITERKRVEKALRNSEAELKAAQRVARIGNWYLDLATGALNWSEEIYRVFDRDPKLPAPTYAELGQYLTVASTQRMNAAVENSKQTGTPYEIDLELFRADGTAKWILAVGEVVRDDTGQIVGLRGTAQDISERKAQELKIARLSRIQAMLSGINMLIVRVRDRDELFREACRIAVKEGGFRVTWIGIVDRSAMKILPIASAGAEPEFLALIKDHFSLCEEAPLGYTMGARAVWEKKAIVSNEILGDPRVVFAKDRTERGISSIAILPLLVSDDAVGIFALEADEVGFFDEEEMKLLMQLAGDIAFAIDHIDKQARLEYLAYYDVLTGLANRTLFLERVTQYMRSAISGGHKLALFLIDLDRFKNINDSLGRPAGDSLLRQVAEWLTRNAGDANLLARVGTDHFAVLLPVVKQEGDVARFLEKSLAALVNHPFSLSDTVFRIAAKAGVALFPDDGADADTLFRNAEVPLKKAKASGERYLFYTQKMTETVADRLTLENQLRQALDKGEFVLHYQPKVNLASGKLTGAEALIRWNDPRTGLVPPGRFIPILEETGLIYEVGRWALRKAIEDYLRWRAAGLSTVRIAVNVSPLQLRSRGFAAEIKQAIGTDAHAPAGLELEITESLIMEHVKHNILSLKAIRDMGVTIAIDDFGTGFSSLSYLAKLPVDTLKIDRSFVTDMTAGPEGLALVSTIINLAHSLKLKVVAEGVETEEQSRLLRLLSCDEMQGFIFSKPVPSDIFEAKFLAANNPQFPNVGKT